jgi:hypothetical protein
VSIVVVLNLPIEHEIVPVQILLLEGDSDSAVLVRNLKALSMRITWVFIAESLARCKLFQGLSLSILQLLERPFYCVLELCLKLVAKFFHFRIDFAEGSREFMDKATFYLHIFFREKDASNIEGLLVFLL